jgi:Multidrug resistance efflux pump
MNRLLILAAVAVTGLWSCSDDNGKYDATGSFEAIEVIVSSEANGKILSFNINEGDRISAGDIIGHIDSLQLYYKKEQLRAGLRAVDIRKPDIRKQIAVLEQQIATAESERKRMQNLVDAKAGNQKALDDITNQLAFLRKQYDAQNSTLAKTSGSADAEAEGLVYQVMQLEDMLAKCRITNPQTGVILAKYVEAGELAVQGKPLYKVADTDLLYLRAYVTASQLSQLKAGQDVRVFADYGDDGRKEYPGIITWVSSKAEFTPKGIQTKDERANLVYAIKVAVQNDGYLKIGQYGEMKFQ